MRTALSRPLRVPQHRTFISLAASQNTASAAITNLSSSLKGLCLNNNTTLVQQPVRTVTKFSLKKGIRKSVHAVPSKFFRLHWGGWIRPRCGRHKKMHKKSAPRKRRLRQHVLVNATQTTLLDKMVTKFWKRPKYYIDDPYEPYHTRTFPFARKTPKPIPPPVSTYREELHYP